MHYDDLIIKLDKKFQECECEVWRKPRIGDDREVELFATRIQWNVIRIAVHMFVDYVAEPTPVDFKNLAEEGLAYAKRAYSAECHGLKLLVSSLAIIPCIVCDRASPNTVSHVTEREKICPPTFRSHGLDIYPVLHCLSNNRTYHWTGQKCRLNNSIWPHARQLVENSLCAVTAVPDSSTSSHTSQSRVQKKNSPPTNQGTDHWWEGQNLG